jgi:excisionase family DNA binding protein
LWEGEDGRLAQYVKAPNTTYRTHKASGQAAQGFAPTFGEIVELMSNDLPQETPKAESDDTSSLWTVDDVANYLRVVPDTIRILARRGKIPSIKIGRGIWRFNSKEIKDWVNNSVHQTS